MKKGGYQFDIEFKALLTTSEEINDLIRQANGDMGLCRPYRLDAYIFAGKDVDRGTETTAKSRLSSFTPRPTGKIPWEKH